MPRLHYKLYDSILAINISGVLRLKRDILLCPPNTHIPELSLPRTTDKITPPSTTLSPHSSPFLVSSTRQLVICYPSFLGHVV